MAQVQLVFDPVLKIKAQDIADLWAGDPEVAALLSGPPEVRRGRPLTYLPGVVELVVIPLAVNVASTVLIGLALRIYRRYRPSDEAQVKEIEPSSKDSNQDRIIVTSAADLKDPDVEPKA